jgi:hypothetical protein
MDIKILTEQKETDAARPLVASEDEAEMLIIWVGDRVDCGLEREDWELELGLMRDFLDRNEVESWDSYDLEDFCNRHLYTSPALMSERDIDYAVACWRDAERFEHYGD